MSKILAILGKELESMFPPSDHLTIGTLAELVKIHGISKDAVIQVFVPSDPSRGSGMSYKPRYAWKGGDGVRLYGDGSGPYLNVSHLLDYGFHDTALLDQGGHELELLGWSSNSLTLESMV